MNKSTNHVFAAFLELTERCHGWLATRLRPACGYSAEVLRHRLTQRLIEIAILPFTLLAHTSLRQAGAFPGPDTRVVCNEAVIQLGPGTVALSARQRLRHYVQFLAHWAYALSQIVLSCGGRRLSPPAVLVTDFTDEHLFVDGRDDRFVDYCRRGPLTPLRTAQRIFIVSLAGHASSVPGFIRYCRHPLISLLREAPLGFGARSALIVRHLTLLATFTAAVLRRPELSLVAKDFPYTCIASALDRAGLITDIITTCSVWVHQPLWMRALSRAKVHMVWYSQAPQSATYITDDVKSDAPQTRWIAVDTHWAWTHAYAEYLRRCGQDTCAVQVVGPIVWQMPIDVPRDPSTINVLVFDVPAVNDDVMLMLGEITNNFHPDNLHAFIRDIVALGPQMERAFGKPVSIRVKMKRGYTEQYAKPYFDYIEGLGAAGVVLLSKHSENIYALVGAADLVIAYPWTSPAYVAEAMGVPAIYYDPTGKVVPEFYSDSPEAVLFARGPGELRSTAVRMLERAAGREHPRAAAADGR